MTATGAGSTGVTVLHRFQAPTPGWQGHLSQQVRYLGHEGTPLFTSTGLVSGEEARAGLRARVGQHVAFHQLILSPSSHGGLGKPDVVQTWTRGVLELLEMRLGQTVWYVAAAHRGPRRVAHSHVLLAGTGLVRATRRRCALLLRLEDCAFLRDAGADHAAHLAGVALRRHTELNCYSQTRREDEVSR